MKTPLCWIFVCFLLPFLSGLGVATLNSPVVFVCQVKYREGWEKSKGKGFEMKLDAMSLLAARASGELASNVGFLSLTPKCIRNGSHKMSAVPQEKNNDC